MSDFELKRLNVFLFHATRNVSPWCAVRVGNEISVRHDSERPRMNGPRRTGEVFRLPEGTQFEEARQTIIDRLNEERVESAS